MIKSDFHTYEPSRFHYWPRLLTHPVSEPFDVCLQVPLGEAEWVSLSFDCVCLVACFDQLKEEEVVEGTPH